MEAAAAYAQTVNLQHALSTIAASLMLTAYLFPKEFTVKHPVSHELHDLKKHISRKDYLEFDYVIVGAGTAGSVIADRLTQCPYYSVLAIEAGDDPSIDSLWPALFPFLSNSKSDWNFTAVNFLKGYRHNDTLPLHSGHVLGGSLSINHLLYSRGCPGDYCTWAKIAKSDIWSYNNILPLFIETERLENKEILNSLYRYYHGTKGFLGVTREKRNQEVETYLKSFREIGHKILLDSNGPDVLGYFMQLYTLAEGTRQTTALTNLGANKWRPNLHILRNTLVTKILFDKNNNAIGVKALTNNDKVIIIKATREVIISAGAINTPKLLMLSGIGPSNYLSKLDINVISDLPVGRNLRDHLLLLLVFKMEHSKAPSIPYNPHEYPVPFFTGLVSLNKSNLCPEYQSLNAVFLKDSPFSFPFCQNTFDYDAHTCQAVYEANRGRNIIFTLMTILHPKSHGYVKLRSTNPKESPIVYLGTLTDPRDIDDLIDYIEDHIRVLNSTYYRKIKAELVDFRLDACTNLPFASREYWRCYIPRMTGTISHFSSTCSMGSVVDSQLRVFNVHRLRIADASIMPTTISGNPAAVVVMIGEMVSRMILKETQCTYSNCNKPTF